MSRADNPNTPIRHMVMLKFREGTTEEQIAKYRDWQREMADDVGFAYNFVQGPALDPRFHNAYFDWIISIDLEGYRAMDGYMSHWSHLRDDARSNDACSIIEQLMAFDFELKYPYGRTAYDEKAAEEDYAKEKVRRERIHPDPAKAYVPELRGRFIEEAKDIAARVGVEIDEEPEFIIGSSWAPGRINNTIPAAQTEVEKGSKVKIIVSGDYLMGVDVPYVVNERPASPTGY